MESSRSKGPAYGTNKSNRVIKSTACFLWLKLQSSTYRALSTPKKFSAKPNLTYEEYIKYSNPQLRAALPWLLKLRDPTV